MRLAWLGPPPADGGAVPHVAAQIVRGLSDRGATVDRGFPQGDSGAFERRVRDLIAELRGEGRRKFQDAARGEAERRFSEGRIVRLLEAALSNLVGQDER